MRVIHQICAILAAATLMSVMDTSAQSCALPPSPPTDAEDVTKEVPVVFRLRDGVQISGTLAAWDQDGFDGSFGKRRWIELRAEDAWRVLRRLIDETKADDWIVLGRMSLLHDDIELRAETAFAEALALDPDAGERIERAREVALAIREAKEREASDAVEELSQATLSPEAAEWPSDPWPVLDAADAEAARLALFTDAEAILDKTGLTIEPVESEYFIVYTDAPRADAATWAVQVLDRWYGEAAQALGIDDRQNLFWGKAVVFVFQEQDQFRLVEAGTFDQLVPLDLISITHYSGPKVFINAWRSKDSVEFEASLVRAMVRGMLHRFHSPLRLPAWANEGFAEYFAQRRVDESTYSEGNRPQGFDLVRSGYPVSQVFDMQYSDATWPGPQREGEALSALLIEFLMKTDRAAFIEWLKAVKSGFEWRGALEQHYGGSMQAFVDRFVLFYRAND